MLKQIMLVVLIVLLGVSSYYLYNLLQEMSMPPISLIGNVSSPSGEIIDGELQFYPNMRFASPQISYSVGEECDSEKRQSIEDAFDMLSDISDLTFSEEDEGQISIDCKETSLRQIRRETYYIAGEGGPTSVINTSLFYVIQGGEVLLLYPKSSCDFPIVEVHELLHVLGFTHSSSQNSIMYPTASCSQRITNEIIEKLEEVYSFPQKADLYFDNASASKSGAYLDFNVNIKNRGLDDAEEVSLLIYADDKNIKNYSLNSIDFGEGKFLEVANLRIGREVSSIRIIIEGGEEIYDNNNIVSFSVPG